MKPCYTVQVEGQYAVTLHQGNKREGRLFRVTYGAEQTLMLSYDEACSELGACIMHALACNGQIDNSYPEDKE